MDKVTDEDSWSLKPPTTLEEKPASLDPERRERIIAAVEAMHELW